MKSSTVSHAIYKYISNEICKHESLFFNPLHKLECFPYFASDPFPLLKTSKVFLETPHVPSVIYLWERRFQQKFHHFLGKKYHLFDCLWCFRSSDEEWGMLVDLYNCSVTCFNWWKLYIFDVIFEWKFKTIARMK